MTTTSSPYLHRFWVVDCATEAETADLAKKVAHFLLPGDLLRLEGDLGAGKSTFSRYVLQALGHNGDVPSPTYTLVQLYAPETSGVRVPVAHVDAYRLKDPEEMAGLGLEEYRQHGVVIAEWPEKGGDLLAEVPDYLNYHIQEMNNPGVLTLHFEPGETATARRVKLTASRSWQRRFGLMFDGIIRPRSETSRKAFLDKLGLTNYAIEDIGGDWSFRSFWRVRLSDGSSRILMDAPPPIENVHEFSSVAAYYRSIGLRAPEEFGRDEVNGYMLVEDFGSKQLLKQVNSGLDATPWYTTAVDVLCHLCKHPAMPQGRSFSPRDWWIDAARFTDWYIPLATGKATPVAERQRFMDLWAAQFERMNALPKGTLPWDYQATNMMLLADEPSLQNFGLIDIQDARTAPIVMDMAILLRDIRRDQDDALEARMLDHVASKLNISRDALLTGLHIGSLHHCSRIMGGFSRLAMRDGRTGPALRFMQRVWDIAHQSAPCPELKELFDFMLPYQQAGLDKLANIAAQNKDAA